MSLVSHTLLCALASTVRCQPTLAPSPLPGLCGVDTSRLHRSLLSSCLVPHHPPDVYPMLLH
eukprot:3706253-Rhodomonas_salina.4